MRYTISDKIIAYLALISGLSISAVAIYYSVAGLMAIFAAAVIPIMIMGVVLEIGKLSATVWLKQNWLRAPRFLKAYLLVAILALMLLTSMGIFGYLSKAHLDQAVPTGDVAAKVALLDEKIKTERDNIETARTALKQMDEQVNARLNRSDDEKGAERAVQIRRNQQAERGRLQKDIAESQARIAKLNEERAPIASELRKVEAEVGPIKYIAALIYGDQADQNLLERAVRWVIIVIVLVFDPLAVILLLASQYSFNWFRQQNEDDIREEYDFSKGRRGPIISDENEEMASDLAELNQSDKTSIDIQSTDDKNEQAQTSIDEDQSIVTENNESQPAEDSEPPEIEKASEEEADEKRALVEWNTMIAEAEKAVELEKEEEDKEIIDAAADSEKQAMKAWKHDNPDSSLKSQRRLLEKGVIDKLPWEDYLKPKADFGDDDAAVEAAKWAMEQLNKKQEDRGHYIGLDTKENATAESLTWMEHDQDGNQIIKSKQPYQQNAEQNENTIWKRIQDAKK